MTSIFSDYLEPREFDEDDIKDLELAFKYDDDESRAQTIQVVVDKTYYIEQNKKFQETYTDTWDEIVSTHYDSNQTKLLQDPVYLFNLCIDILFPQSPKKNKFINHIKNIQNNANRNLNTIFESEAKKTNVDTSSPKLKTIDDEPSVKFLGFTQEGGATFFLVDDILKLNNNGINWCELDQQKCTNDNDNYDNFSDMLFRFIEYTNDNECKVKLIHPHDLYEQWGGEDSDDLIFPEKYLKNNI